MGTLFTNCTKLLIRFIAVFKCCQGKISPGSTTNHETKKRDSEQELLNLYNRGYAAEKTTSLIKGILQPQLRNWHNPSVSHCRTETRNGLPGCSSVFLDKLITTNNMGILPGRFHLEPDRVFNYTCEIFYEKKRRFEKQW